MSTLDKNANARLGQIVREHREFIAAMAFKTDEYQRTEIERKYRTKAYRYLVRRNKGGASFPTQTIIDGVMSRFGGPS